MEGTAGRVLVDLERLGIVRAGEADDVDDTLDEAGNVGLARGGKGGEGGSAGIVDFVAVVVEDFVFGEDERVQPGCKVGGGEEVVVLGDEGVGGEKGGVGDGGVVGVKAVAREVVERVRGEGVGERRATGVPGAGRGVGRGAEGKQGGQGAGRDVEE